jgi:hypothetical protein
LFIGIKCRSAASCWYQTILARKLKTYHTSLGFFDQAIAAPSMKAALAAWGADSNLFHQGAAKESTDPDIIAATMAKPGVVLKRPVGSNSPFTEHADLPTELGNKGSTGRPGKERAKPKKLPLRKPDDKAARKAALNYEKQEKRRKLEEAAREKERERRQQAVNGAQVAFNEAKGEHEERSAAINAEREALEKKSQAEDARWEKQRHKLKTALRRAHET